MIATFMGYKKNIGRAFHLLAQISTDSTATSDKNQKLARVRLSKGQNKQQDRLVQ